MSYVSCNRFAKKKKKNDALPILSDQLREYSNTMIDSKAVVKTVEANRINAVRDLDVTSK